MSLIKRKGQKEFRCDADYIRAIKDEALAKEERDVCQYELYTKYLPLIKKMSHKFNLSKEDAEDYLSESFFTVLNVIEYTDISKIDDNYSFGYFLRFHLLNAGIQSVKKSVRRTAKVGTKVSWDAIVEGGNYRPDEMMISEEEAFADTELYNEKAQVASVLSKVPSSVISDRDKKVMKKALDGYSSQEIASMFDLSHQRILKIRRHVIDVLQTEMREYAY